MFKTFFFLDERSPPITDDYRRLQRSPSLDTRPNFAPPTTFEVGKFGLVSLRWGEIMPDLKLSLPIKLSGRALYDDGQMINSNVINHVTNSEVIMCKNEHCHTWTQWKWQPCFSHASSLDTTPNLAPPTTFEVGKFGLALLHWGEIICGSISAVPIKLSGLYTMMDRWSTLT